MMPAGGSTSLDTGDGEDSPDEEDPVEEPNTDTTPPERGDTEDSKRAMIQEMRTYARFCQNRFDTPERMRPFNFKVTPQGIVDMVTEAIETHGDTRDNIKQLFNAVIQGLEDS